MLPDRLPLFELPDGLVDFVHGTLMDQLTVATPKVGGEEASCWCPQWQEHPDAVHRLAAIYDEWCTMLSAEDAQLHAFLRDVLDYHLPLLVSLERGAFRACKHGHLAHRRLDAPAGR